VALGRIPGEGADLGYGASASASASPAPGGAASDDSVRMFELPGGGSWPDGVYRFDVFTRDGPPAQLYACIRP
jgi:hypothetical protein